MAALTSWHWPGNVRELKNVVARAVVIARSDLVTLDDLLERMRTSTAAAPSDGRGSMPGAAAPGQAPGVLPQPPAHANLDYKERLRLEMDRYETNLIVDALSRAGGNVTAAAQALEIPVRTLTHKMQALGIKKRSDPA
jgi:DNA-binding NtrC family response regulator